nr:uncharacterized protein LOC111970439 isoform X2 [Salvelinus alpinus]
MMQDVTDFGGSESFRTQTNSSGKLHFFVEVTVFFIFLCFQLEYRHIFRIQRLQHLPFNLYGFYNVTHHETPCHSAILGDSNDKHPAFCSSLLSWGTLQNPFGNGRPRVQSDAQPSAFGLTFHKFAQVEVGTEFPHLTFFLLIHNIGPPGGTNLSKLAIRDFVSGIAPLQSGGMVVETGFQTFTIDSLPAGSQYVVTYTALINGHKSEILDLPNVLQCLTE